MLLMEISRVQGSAYPIVTEWKLRILCHQQEAQGLCFALRVTFD